MKTCPRCGLSEPYPKIDLLEATSRQCYYCDLTDKIEMEAKKTDLRILLDQIRGSGEYDCLIGISGGLDSSLLLYLAVTEWKLKPLVIHYDNGYNTEVANQNIDLLVKSLGVTFIRFYLNIEDVNAANLSLIHANVPDADIHNDMVMAYFMNKTAIDYKIKYILNGHNYRTEGTSPIEWSYMDAAYLESITWQSSFKNTIGLQLKTSRLGIKQVRPFYYIPEIYLEDKMQELFRLGIKPYSCKHGENWHTLFVGAYYLPNRFGIDKDSTTYKAARRRNGLGEAVNGELPKDLFDHLPFTKDWIDKLEKVPVSEIEKNRSRFASYRKTFRRYRYIFYILTKLGFFPRLFYEKYCKG